MIHILLKVTIYCLNVIAFMPIHFCESTSHNYFRTKTYPQDERQLAVDGWSETFNTTEITQNIESSFGFFRTSLSDDGTRFALGATTQFRVFALENGNWTQLGSTITTGVNPDELQGFYVSLSGDGTRVAALEIYPADSATACRVRVFEYDSVNMDWDILGDENGISAPLGNQFGKSVSLSEDGSTLACGASSEDPGDSVSVTVYVYDGVADSWSPLGSDLDTENVVFWSLKVVSLSADGSTLAIGGSRFGASETKVFTYDGSNWSQLGSNMMTATVFFTDSYFVTLSGDASTCAIMANDVSSGTVETVLNVYGYDSSAVAWNPKGSQFELADNPFDFVQTVALTDDGDTICYGEINGNSAYNVNVLVYDTEGTSWVQKGSDILALAEDSKPVAISGDGSVVSAQESTTKVSLFTYQDPTPSSAPSESSMPSLLPTFIPSSVPSLLPTSKPSASPSILPTRKPSAHPSKAPTMIPSAAPTKIPSAPPTLFPSEHPTASPIPSVIPTTLPSSFPSINPSQHPSDSPSLSVMPSTEPSKIPTGKPTITTLPSLIPSAPPTSAPGFFENIFETLFDFFERMRENLSEFGENARDFTAVFFGNVSDTVTLVKAVIVTGIWSTFTFIFASGPGLLVLSLIMSFFT